MKRLLTVLAMASVFAAAPAVADYDSCMKYCTPEHGFDHCNPICAGGEQKADGKENKADRESAGNFGPCNDNGDKADAIFKYAEQYHGELPSFVTYGEVDPNNPNEWAVKIFFHKYICKGIFTFTDNCDLFPDYQCKTDWDE